MSEKTASSPPLEGFLLSLAELKAILTLVEIDAFPGLEENDPALGQLMPEQEAYGLICGERALRARGFAYVDDQGGLRIHNDLLEAIGVCTYAPNMLAVTLFPADNETPHQFTVFHLDNHYISHMLPEPGFHLFTRYRDRQAAIDDLIRLVPDVKVAKKYTLLLPETDLTEARKAVDEGDIARSRALLVKNQANREAADVFLSVLREPHVMLYFQAIRRLDQDTISLQSIMALGTSQMFWMTTEREPEVDVQTPWFDIRTVDRDTLAHELMSLSW